jgi:WD40 repeat protein/serine/threonine protein kinase
MAAGSPCPPASRLRRLLSGPADGPGHAELLGHLDHCSACRRLLDRLAGADEAVLAAVRTLRQSAWEEGISLRRLLQDLERDVSLRTLCRSHDRAADGPSPQPPAALQEPLGLFHDYEVKEVLGQGGMGLVLKAFDPALQRWVAIKVLAPSVAGHPVARMRFAREGRAAAAVRHEHVITIHAVSEAHGLPFMVMEYLAGGTLKDYLDRHGPPPWRDVARLGAEIASGLAAAHAQGLIHRDIKPSNILLAPNSKSQARNPKSEIRSTKSETDTGRLSGNPHAGGGGENLPETEGGLALDFGSRISDFSAKIGDFGVARIADGSNLTETGEIAGTPMYMAPEQALGQALDRRADLFSLGSVLYTLCTGREPFAGGSPMAVFRQVCEQTPPPVRSIAQAVPAWLAAVVERLHAKRPADRFGSADEVAELLRYNLTRAGEPAFTPRFPPAARPRRGTRRVLALTALGLLLTGGLLVSDWHPWSPRAGSGAPARRASSPVRLRATLRGHRGPVWCAAFSPDGRWLATGSDDTTLRFWDAATGREKGRRREHSGAVFAVAFAPSGKFLISGSGDGLFRLWDRATGRELPALPRRSSNVRRAAFSSGDLMAVLVSNSQGVELWGLGTRTRRLTLLGHHGTILAIAFAKDGRTLATGDARGRIRLWDPATGAERARFAGDRLGLRALAFAPDGRTLASAGTGDRTVKLWDVATHQPVATLSGHEHGLVNVAFSPSGNIVAAGGRDGTVILWDVHSPGRPLATLPAHQGAVWGLAFSPDGGTLATVGEDRLGKLWDLAGLSLP